MPTEELEKEVEEPQEEEQPQNQDKRKKRTKKKRRHISARTVRTVICCVLLFALFAALPAFANTAIGYVPIVAFVFVLVLSFVYLLVLKHCLVFEEIGANAGCVRGENLPFQLSITNKSILPAVRVDALFYISDLFGNEGATTTRFVTLPPRSTKVFDFGVRFDHIGTYQVGIKQIGIYDILGIFYHVRTNDELHEVSVKPRLFDIEGVEISTETALESKQSITTVINDGMDYCGVREYVWGDPIKAIHWKLSARTADGEYYTRLYETTTNPGIEVLVDLDSLPYTPSQMMSAFDAVVETAFSIERWASKSGMDSEVLFVDALGARRRFEGPFNDKYDELLERMPRIAQGNGRALVEMLHSEAASIYAQSNLIVCSACITNELMSEMLSVKAGKRNPVMFAVVPANVEDEEREKLVKPLRRLGAAGVAYSILEGADELEERG